LSLNPRVIRKKGRKLRSQEIAKTPPPLLRKLEPGARNIIQENPKDIPGTNAFVFKR